MVTTPAPSDCDDSITIWFPELGLCINNLDWSTLFNIFPIRGEEYRDPHVVLTGLDHIPSLQADTLLGAHGPPVSERVAIAHSVTLHRDSIQFLWDQTVRGINKGLTLGELCESIKLPAVFADSYLTTQYDGVVEHHVCQQFRLFRPSRAGSLSMYAVRAGRSAPPHLQPTCASCSSAPSTALVRRWHPHTA